MEEQNKLTIPIKLLPDNWRNDVAAKFQITPNMVGKVANGTRNNADVFNHLLQLAEDGKEQAEQLADRLKQLQPQPAAI